MEALTAVLYVGIAMAFLYFRGRTDGRNAERRKATSPGFVPLSSPAATAAVAVQEFIAPVAIGSRFTYLGVEMLCTAHAVPRPWGMVPGMLAEYVANDGTVRQTMFAGSEIDALKQEIARKGTTS